MTDTAATLDPVPIDRFGHDHWKLLAYVDSYAAREGGLDRRRLRCNPQRHPRLASIHTPRNWNPHHGTRLKPDEEGEQQLPEHDDWDCLHDLEAAGLVEILSLTNGYARLTPEGRRAYGQMVHFQLRGGALHHFTPKAK